MSRSLLAVSLVFRSLAMQSAVAQEVEKACRVMSDTYATIDDATRCAEARGWKVVNFRVADCEAGRGDTAKLVTKAGRIARQLRYIFPDLRYLAS